MSLHIAQHTRRRPGRSAHWISVHLACPHGRHECAVEIPEADGMPTAMLAEVTVHATHALIHHVVTRHRQGTGCTCASPLGLFCWPTTYVISRDSLGAGGSRHATAS